MMVRIADSENGSVVSRINPSRSPEPEDINYFYISIF